MIHNFLTQSRFSTTKVWLKHHPATIVQVSNTSVRFQYFLYFLLNLFHSLRKAGLDSMSVKELSDFLTTNHSVTNLS